MGHLTFLPKRLPVVGNKRISLFFRPWQTRAHCRGHIVADRNVSRFARVHNICCGHKFCVRGTKNVSDFVQKHFVSATNVSQSVRSPRNIMGNNVSATMCPRLPRSFDSASEPRSRVIALVDSTWVFLLLSFYIVISWNMPLFKVWSKDNLDKKFAVAENFAELVPQLL